MFMGLGHVGRQMISAKAAPALNLDFTGGVLDPRITFTRATTASMYDTTGTMVQVASGSARFDNDPNSGRFNFVRNNAPVGSVPGTPGTFPTNWNVPALPSGITVTTGAVTNVGGINVIPFTFSGTAGASGVANVVIEITVGSIGQTWTGSVYAQLVSGSFPHAANIELDELTSALGFLGASTTSWGSPATLTRVSVTRTLSQATMSRLRLYGLNAIINNGDVVNFTVYIGLPQLERGSTPTAPILTSGTALGSGMLPRGLLVEEQRTNLVTNSGPLTDFVATTASKTATASQAPDGTFTGVRLTEDATASVEHYMEFSFTPTANAVYTGSCFVRAAGRANIGISLTPTGNWVGGRVAAPANLSAGTIAVTAGTAVATIQPMVDGWLRIAVTATAAAAPSGSSTLRVGLCDNSGNISYSGDGVSDGHFWGAQLEVGGFVTSYISTTTAAVPRNGDQTTMPLGSWFNQNNGTLLVEYMLPIAVNASGNVQTAVSLSDGTLANRYSLRAQAPGGQAASYTVVRASVIVTSGNMFTNTALLKQKAAISYSPTAQLGTGLGQAPQALAAAVPNGPLTSLDIGFLSASASQLDGYITNVRYWNYTMTAAQLQNVTT